MRWPLVALPVALLFGSGCTRSQPTTQTVELKAAFSEETVVARLTATWRPAAPTTEKNADRWLAVRVTVTNLLADRLYVRLSDVRLAGPDVPIPLGQSDVQCVLPAHGTSPVFDVDVAVAGNDAARIRGIECTPTLVPLSERGRAFYREFLLQKRPGDQTAIDAELGAYAAVAACPSAPQ